MWDALVGFIDVNEMILTKDCKSLEEKEKSCRLNHIFLVSFRRFVVQTQTLNINGMNDKIEAVLLN